MWPCGMSFSETADFLRDMDQCFLDWIMIHSWSQIQAFCDEYQDDLRDYIESELGRDPAEESA